MELSKKISSRYVLAAAIGILVAVIDIIFKTQAAEQGVTNPNPGIAFGWVSFLGSEKIVLAHTLLLLLIGWFIARSKSQLINLLLNVLIFSSLSNLYDRIFLGYVRDYINVATYSVNLADIATNITVLFIIVVVLLEKLWKNLQLKNKMPDKD